MTDGRKDGHRTEGRGSDGRSRGSSWKVSRTGGQTFLFRAPVLPDLPPPCPPWTRHVYTDTLSSEHGRSWVPWVPRIRTGGQSDFTDVRRDVKLPRLQARSTWILAIGRAGGRKKRKDGLSCSDRRTDPSHLFPLIPSLTAYNVLLPSPFLSDESRQPLVA